jgi:cell division protein ZapB
MDTELAALEERVDTLIAYARELRAANELLRGELLASQERNRDLSARMAQATERLDALIARMPIERVEASE